MPPWLQAAVRRYLSQDDRSAASVAETTPLSKHVAYKLDYWCAATCHKPTCLANHISAFDCISRLALHSLINPGLCNDGLYLTASPSTNHAQLWASHG